MAISIANNILSDNISILKSEVSRTAYQGVAVAILSIIIATLLVCYYQFGEISIDGIINAQKNNYSLWVLNGIPFVFALWGQYSGSIIAHQVNALIVDQTQELRSRADDLEKQASYAATHDVLTGLPNRSLFYDRVGQAILSANHQKTLLSILLVEIVNFKDVYDTLGRNSSDQIVRQISSRLQGVVLGTDRVAMIDGNIFSMLISDSTDEKEVELLAKHIQKVLEPAFVIERLTFAAHTNVGIVHFPQHGEDVDTLVQKAGVALYMAGRSNEGYAVYELSFDKHSPRRLTLMSELRNAIEKDQLLLYYQPKVSISTGILYGAEALVRWQHPKHGFISPDEFIPMAERTRMIKLLTLWVLKEAFQQCAKWRKQRKELTISVNLSAKDLHDSELPDLISGVAVSTGIKPEWIILEITESSIMTDPELTLEVIERLNKMGYQLSIDDYGTGYSSLAYLKKMPLTELKIDRSFVQDILSSENDDVIVKATINLAHNLGFHVTAEGVESIEILDKLKTYGCDIAQGYYLSKPMPVEDFNQWMEVGEWKPVILS
jgi:diguanylate cyclase (GGDEF)-like protein